LNVEVSVPSLAKLNLDLRVLHRRPDGYHELRTIFQTISLADHLRIAFTAARRTAIEVASSVEIADNLAARAAELACRTLRIKGRISIALEKRIPLGAGLGGGSSNAASVLRAIPALAGRSVPLAQLAALAAELGSDVPFFLYGGTALGLGRGTEVYPLPDQPARPVVVVDTGVHVSTAHAYRSLQRPVTNALTSPDDLPILREFQANTWKLDDPGASGLDFTNDFERPVFQLHGEVSRAVRKLRRLGALVAHMTGSGSAVFGLFATSHQALAAAGQFAPGQAHAARFVSRARYRSLWRRALPGKFQ
jgi:4-diphosphocytidyl-2-C-methyl-D-erythritol kinase